MSERSEELYRRIKDDPYNEVSAHAVNGGLAIMLSHRITMDAAAVVFVPEDKVLFLDHDEDEKLLEKLNHGGDWT